jgi:hypothetical protein
LPKEPRRQINDNIETKVRALGPSHT